MKLFERIRKLDLDLHHVEEAERLYREMFRESAPRYGFTDTREYVDAMRTAVARGEPMTLEDIYGEELAAQIEAGEIVTEAPR